MESTTRGRAAESAGQKEAGSFLVVIMVIVAITSIALGAAVQSWTVRLRRDKEEELIFRAQQYVKAILAYRKEHAGQFPTNLEDLFKPGPRQLRYIRKLYKDPLMENGRWGLLYLVPGGRAVIDVVAAQKAQQQKESQWGNEWETAGDQTKQAGAGTVAGGLQPGVTPIGNLLGVPGAGGQPSAAPVAAPQAPVILPPIPKVDESSLDEDAVSEPPIGWPIVGVVSRSGGTGSKASDDPRKGGELPLGGGRKNPADRTYKVYKGHDDIADWQFHVFDFGADLPQAPGVGVPHMPGQPGPIGPGHGGKGTFRLGPGGPMPGRPQPGVPGYNPKGEGGKSLIQKNSGNKNKPQYPGQNQGSDPDDQ